MDVSNRSAGVLAFYFLPTIVALVRGHWAVSAVFVLNFLLGWTLIGWMVALVWAFAGYTRGRIGGTAQIRGVIRLPG
jgi:uncharacterized membrane protein YqaE (UPF0057 family)